MTADKRYITGLIILFLLLGGTGAVSAQSLKQLEAQRKAALKEIDVTTQLLKEAQKSAKNSFNRLNLLTQQVMERRKIIDLLNQEIVVIDKHIADLNDELSQLEQDLAVKQDKYTRSLKGLYNHRSIQQKWMFVLSAHSFTQSIRRMRYLREYADWQKREAMLIMKKQEEINQKQAELEKTRSEKTDLLNERENENKKLQQEETDKKKEYQQLEKKQQNLQATLNKKKKQAQDLNKKIEELIAKEAAKSEKASGSRKADTAGGYAMTKEEQKLSNDFVANKGQLPYPLKGQYKIIGAFGEHQHPEWKHVRVNNNGIEIQTIAGTEAQSVFNGVVTSVFVVPGYNNGVIVRHGNYLTIYANLSEVYVKTGDTVSTYQKIGKIYTDTENGNSTILHFEIRKEKDKLDPELWLY